MITRKDIEKLANVDKYPCTSIYIPTHRAGHNQEDQLRYKNALNEAARQLDAHDLDQREIQKWFEPARTLQEDSEFWLHQSDGLAVFIGVDQFKYFQVPIDFNPFIWVGPDFFLRPLLPLFSTDRLFYLLALSKNKVRFFECTRWSITPMKIEDVVPASIKALPTFMSERESGQMHSGQGSGQPPIYHGHNENNASEKELIKDYVRTIEEGLREALGEHPSPLLLAGVDYLTNAYRQESGNEDLLPSTVSGNTDDDDPALLHEKAVWELGDFFIEDRQAYARQFEAYLAEGRASAAITDIVPAAVSGRVAALFCHNETRTWGAFEPKSHQASLHEEQSKDSIELLNFAAINAFLQGAEIFNVDRENMPFPSANLNAIYRF